MMPIPTAAIPRFLSGCNGKPAQQKADSLLHVRDVRYQHDKKAAIDEHATGLLNRSKWVKEMLQCSRHDDRIKAALAKREPSLVNICDDGSYVGVFPPYPILNNINAIELRRRVWTELPKQSERATANIQDSPERQIRLKKIGDRIRLTCMEPLKPGVLPILLAHRARLFRLNNISDFAVVVATVHIPPSSRVSSTQPGAMVTPPTFTRFA
jgi:hypothetical protein